MIFVTSVGLSFKFCNASMISIWKEVIFEYFFFVS